MKGLRFVTLTLTLFISALTIQAQTTWSVDDAHSNIQFTVQHMVIAEVEGRFNDFEGTVRANNNDFTDSQVSFTANVKSIDTGNEKRDGHLKSDDFFNAEAYPYMTFEGKLIKENNDYRLVGDLSIRDVTKQTTFDVEYLGTVNTGNGLKAGFKITGSVNRFEYNLNWDNTIQDGSLVVGEEIQISCNIELNADES